MVETVTLNYGWVKPEIQHSPTTWGGYLNTNLDAIDALVFANQMGVTPIGGIQMYAGDTAPPNFLMCDGLVYQNSAIPLLAPILKNRFNAGTSAVVGTSSAVPNINAKFPLGANAGNPLGSVGGSYSVTINLANLPPHNHPASQDAHVHAAWQDGHNHSITTGNHAHGITTGGHSHAIHTGGHSHTIPDNLVVGSGSGLTNGGASFSLHGGATTGGVGDLGGNTDTAGNLGGNTDTAGNLGGYTDSRAPGVYTDNHQPNVYTANTGSGAALSVVPVYIALNYIIRYQ